MAEQFAPELMAMIDPDKWLAATPLTVFKNMYVEAGEPTEEAWHGDLGDLLGHYRGQACWSPYRTDIPMRIAGDHEDAVHWSGIVAEVDAPKTARPDPANYARVLDALGRAEGDGDIRAPLLTHATKSIGTRIFWGFEHPWIAPLHEYALRWIALANDLRSALEPYGLEEHGLHVDLAPKDPSRIWRVPFFAVNRRENSSGTWVREMDTYDRAFDIFSLDRLEWSDLRAASEEERGDAGAHPVGWGEVQPLRIAGDIDRRWRIACAKLPRLTAFLTCFDPIPAQGTNGWNRRFSTTLASVCCRLRGDAELLRATLDRMLDHIEGLGGDRDHWYRGRARSTLRWCGQLEEIEGVKNV